MTAHIEHVMDSLRKSNKTTGYKMTEGSFHSILQGYFGYTASFATKCAKQALELGLVSQ